MEENEKREIEIVAQIKASVETINKCLVELDAMHATMKIEQPSEERQEVGPKDEQEAEQIDDAENVASETTEEKEDADNEKKYRY